jgi:hypothetical protein
MTEPIGGQSDAAFRAHDAEHNNTGALADYLAAHYGVYS